MIRPIFCRECGSRGVVRDTGVTCVECGFEAPTEVEFQHPGEVGVDWNPMPVKALDND